MPIPALARKDFAAVLETILSDHNLRSAWKYVAGGKAVIRATRRFKSKASAGRGELVVTFGALNFADRQYIAALKGRAVPRHVHSVAFKPGTKAADL